MMRKKNISFFFKSKKFEEKKTCLANQFLYIKKIELGQLVVQQTPGE